MRIILYAANELGRRTYEYLKQASGIEVRAICCDSEVTDDDRQLLFAENVEEDYDVGTAVIDINGLKMLFSGAEADAVIVATENEYLDFCVRRLSEAGADNIAVVPSYYEDIPLLDDSFIWVDKNMPRLPYLEYHISFHCNLKCSGCTHFSNIIPEDRYGDFDAFCDDMLRLQELFWGIGRIRLMGGEPLLNERLPDFIYAARDAFADADIRVVSNGLMLREDNDALFEAMRATSTYFDISMYPPTAGSIGKISQICENHGVKLTTTPPIEEFYASMNLHGQNDPEVAFDNCPARHCTYLYEGMISTCAMPQLIGIYNDRFNLNIQPGPEDVINIYDGNLTGYELLRKLKSPMDICSYCDSERRSYKWFVSTEPSAGEWISKI